MASQGNEVIRVDKRPPPAETKNVTFSACDITDYPALTKALVGTEVVFNTAIIQIPEINEKKRLAYDVNARGTQNICRVVDELPSVRGMIQAGSWHIIGEREITGTVDEEYGYRPDKVEDRARLYAISKIIQESTVRYYDEMSDKVFGIIRTGTVMGENMPKGTAANIFIEKGIRGEKITPYASSAGRPMLYVWIDDVVVAYSNFAKKIIGGLGGNRSIEHIFNVYYEKPITVLELANIIKKTVEKVSGGRIRPPVEIVGTDDSSSYPSVMTVNTDRARSFLDIGRFKSVEEMVEILVTERMKRLKSSA